MPDPTSTRTHRSTGRLILDGKPVFRIVDTIAEDSETLDPRAVPPPLPGSMAGRVVRIAVRPPRLERAVRWSVRVERFLAALFPPPLAAGTRHRLHAGREHSSSPRYLQGSGMGTVELPTVGEDDAS